MNDKSDDLPKHLLPSATRRCARKKFGLSLAGIALASLFARQANAADLYADASVNANGDGTSARPYWRITDAVERARLLRQSAAIAPAETIVIHVAAGIYLGSRETSVLNKNPRLEVLPIILNVPALTLSGSTVLMTDALGLPTGVQPGTETLITTADHNLQSLILITRTTDGMAGDSVTVAGFHLNFLEEVGTGVFVDRASGFALRQNFITQCDLGIQTTRAIGTIEGNLISDTPGTGLLALGGSRIYPARVRIFANRVRQGLRTGVLCLASGVTGQINVGANSLSIEPLPTSEVRDDPPVTIEATVTGNDLSGNGRAGLGCGFYTPYSVKNLETENLLRPTVALAAFDNSLTDNGLYGFILETRNSPRNDKNPLTGDFAGTFQGNAVAGNGRAPALLTFNDHTVSLGFNSLKVAKYLVQAAYQIADADGELAGFDYDNPVTDPYDGTVLNNTLIVNGTVIPPGKKITP